MPSRLTCACLSCGHVSGRDDFFIERKTVPYFDDICPRCASDDVEVYDASVSMPSFLEQNQDLN